MQQSSVTTHLRTKGRRVIPPRDERPKGDDALVSPSYGWRRDRRWQAHLARRAEDEARRVNRLRAWRKDGVLDRMRANDLGDIADAYAAELAGID